MASLQLKKQLVVSCFLFSILLITNTLQCNSQATSCKSTASEKDPDYYGDSFNTSLDTLPTYQMVTTSGLRKCLNRSELVAMPGDSPGLLRIPRKVQLCTFWSDEGRLTAEERCFTVSFTMTVHEPSVKLSQSQTTTGGRGAIPYSRRGQINFLILPTFRYLDQDFCRPWMSIKKQLALDKDGSPVVYDPVRGSSSNMHVQIGLLPQDSCVRLFCDPSLVVNVTILEPAASPPAATGGRYTVWIVYDCKAHSLSVYVGAGEGSTRPERPIVVKKHLKLRDVGYSSVRFGLLSSVGQLLQVHRWNSKVWMPIDGPINLKKMMIMYRLYQVLVIAIPLALVVSIVVGVSWYLRSRWRRWKKEQEKLAETMKLLPGVPTKIDYAEIRKATGNFNDTTKLGRGGFSSVYRCRLPAAASRRISNGRAMDMDVAVKKFTSDDREAEDRRLENFLAEVSIINRLRHKNIVPLIGWSYHKGVPLLIYEYMANGSLDQHLFRRGGTGPQQCTEDTAIGQWHTRYSIAKDIATGLHYVHHEHEPVVLHRDIKASNIMLDSDFRARLGDFGIACTVAPDRTSATGFAGTMGYVAPDYVMSHRATRQTDIYAFGVLILEIVTGKKNGDVPPDDGHIAEWVWRLYGEGKLLEVVDDMLTGGHPNLDITDEAERLLLLGLACTNPNPSGRPSMAEAVQVITMLAPLPDVPPERPSFVWGRSLDSDDGSTTGDIDGALADTVELLQINQENRPQEEQSRGSTFV